MDPALPAAAAAAAAPAAAISQFRAALKHVGSRWFTASATPGAAVAAAAAAASTAASAAAAAAQPLVLPASDQSDASQSFPVRDW